MCKQNSENQQSFAYKKTSYLADHGALEPRLLHDKFPPVLAPVKFSHLSILPLYFSGKLRTKLKIWAREKVSTCRRKKVLQTESTVCVRKTAILAWNFAKHGIIEAARGATTLIFFSDEAQTHPDLAPEGYGHRTTPSGRNFDPKSGSEAFFGEGCNTLYFACGKFKSDFSSKFLFAQNVLRTI